MKTFWHFISKAFLSVLGLCCGVVLSFVVIFALIASALGTADAHFVNLPDAQGAMKDLGKTAPIIAVIEIKDAISSAKNTAKTIQNFLEGFDKGPLKNRVKGIVIDMDCPGGEVFEIDRVYSMLRFWKERTGCPIYIYVNGLCASGGYYLSCAGNKIYATSSSLIGSVGVRCGPFFNVKEGLNRYGIESDLLTSGKDKAPMNPYTPWTAHDREEQQAIINFIYGQFVDIVTENRPLITKEKLVNILGARIFSPEKAKQEGFIDVVGATKEQVLQDIVVVSKIEDNYRVIGLAADGWWKRMAITAATSPLITGEMKHKLTPLVHNAECTLPYLGL
ncbi:Protease 4,protease 4,signal peptide peptidase SppA, 36K type,Peptidase family S49 [Chlamydia serpentis]|uniref:Protease 4,protease 4,signal peptide peptidase SppA, 36K type,Peptidase family S49 n=1 Tax=Chlamydia serpentis TaxID=1967782 RepID=A0A2R8FBC2_9CHLA|nr:S49 family peptidase [Chlamydia serpentis]SPN73733.1 Protease 4,protease 4,signal peptide peptidase SppA, 36K type,Peptidase family S49 [Chlamydia serpentis]